MEICSEQKNIVNSHKNHYFLKFNENLSIFISNLIDNYKRVKKKEIFINSLFFNDESLYLFFISYSNFKYYLTIIHVTSQEDNLKEIELIIQKQIIFKYGNIKLSEDKKHLVLFNDQRNKVFIIFNYIQTIKINDKIILDNYYENNKHKIIDIKFNLSFEAQNSIDKNIILYGIYCNNDYLSLFNNKVLNKEFQIFFNEPFLDFQIINNINGGYDLFIMNYYGNFKYIKNIDDINNIPKSDKSELFQKIKIYDKIAYNINNCSMLLNNKFIKFYFLPQNVINDKTMKSINIVTSLRATSNTLDIGVLINNNLFIIKKYNLSNKENDDINKEKLDEIMLFNNLLNKFIIKSNYGIYFLDIPYLLNLGLVLKENNSDNNEQMKQEMLLTINEIISHISLSKVLNLQLKNNNNISIIYNFYGGSIILIKNNENNLIIRIYDFEIDEPNLFEDESNNSIIKNNNSIGNEEKLLMKNLLKKIIIEKEQLIKQNINIINKSEYTKKVLEEFSNNIDNLMINSSENSNNINNNINKINELYEKVCMSIKLYGEKIKYENESLNKSFIKRKQISENIDKEEENIKNIKKSIENKLKEIEDNQSKIMKYRNKNNDLLYEYYLKNMNVNNEGKNCANELIKRVNNYILKNIELIQQMKNNTNISYKLDFEQFNNFPLTMKYLNNTQEKEINNIIDLITKLSIIMKNFHEQFKEKEIQ